ncbi:cell division protein FtsQ/DivIB [Sansalvadorimonas verongulae]|uniref:cell division protein FtsQ/DivIB n=1 Tax=Sansalvadorimonas verongulae TaxID=2172824 RepID=UPI0012BC0035|nr:cell division protein FtsQ/DivIB [Sansalvadorimonas verongulae]MTI15239.1 FtsQ-type POTRA domain-containing protein [Sansalvadorimonas verongulae]
MDARRYLQHNHRDELKADSRANKRNKTPRKPLTRREQEERKQALLLWSRRVITALKLLFAGVVLGGLMWSLPKFWAWLDRPIAHVGIGGTFHYLRQEEVQSKLEPFLHSRFFVLDLHRMQRTLESDAWISNVRVRKFWPDRLEVSLEEEVPVARWLSSELLNADGKILTPRPGMIFDDLPVLGGPKGREREIMQQYMTLSLQFRPLSLKVEAVNLTPTGSWSFRVGGVNVQLGGDELIERMQRFSRLYYSKLKSSWEEVKSVDLRYQDGIAVAWLDDNRTTGRLAND